MWVSRSRIGLGIALGLTTFAVACDSSKGGSTLAAGGAADAASLPAADASLDASPITDAASSDAASADAAWCKPPYDCPDASAFDATPPTKPGATTGGDGGGAGLCPSARAAYDSRALRATGPTTAFANAYNAALASTPFGPFAIVVAGSNGTTAAKYQATVAGVMQAAGKIADTTEPGAVFPYSLTQPGSVIALQIAKAEHPFHLAFTRNVDPAGDIVVAGLELTATMDDAGCTSMPTVSATLYIAQSQANAPLGESTLGQLLGATNATLASGPGWAVPLSGSTQEITLP